MVLSPFRDSRVPRKTAGGTAAIISRTRPPMCKSSRRARSRASAGVESSSASRYFARTAASSARGRSGTTRWTKRAIRVENQTKISVLDTLKTVCALAIWRGVSAASFSLPSRPSLEGESQATTSAR